MTQEHLPRTVGIAAALGSAFLFGASTPMSKVLLSGVDPWVLAALLYLGSGLGLAVYRYFSPAPDSIRLSPGERLSLGGAVLAGGVIAPVLLLYGLTHMAASSASLLLNAEAVFTALIAWFVFRENVDVRVALGMMAIVAGAVVLSWSSGMHAGSVWPSFAILAACLAWALDNNLTRKVALASPTWIACVKGLAAGLTNLVLAAAIRNEWMPPSITYVVLAMLVGFLGFGVSLALFVVGLRHLGTARTSAYFSVAPFSGSALSVLILHEPLSAKVLVAGALMGLGVWLHLSERHGHEHTHDALEHEHEHAHDEHHLHVHEDQVMPLRDGKHTHWHRHEPLRHEHAHHPDAHHQHRH